MIGWSSSSSQQSPEEGFAFFSSVKESFPEADMGSDPFLSFICLRSIFVCAGIFVAFFALSRIET
jgi:hypothetical protein